MRRPIYETKDDRTWQEQLVGWFCDHFGFQFIITTKEDMLPYDAILKHLDRAVIYCEVKRRSQRSTSFPTFNISKQKIENLLAACADSDLKSMLLIYWEDDKVLMWTESSVDHLKDEILWGRTDRNDPYDMEASVAIPIEEFNILRAD